MRRQKKKRNDKKESKNLIFIRLLIESVSRCDQHFVSDVSSVCVLYFFISVVLSHFLLIFYFLYLPCQLSALNCKIAHQMNGEEKIRVKWQNNNLYMNKWCVVAAMWNWIDDKNCNKSVDWNSGVSFLLLNSNNLLHILCSVWFTRLFFSSHSVPFAVIKR